MNKLYLSYIYYNIGCLLDRCSHQSNTHQQSVRIPGTKFRLDGVLYTFR